MLRSAGMPPLPRLWAMEPDMFQSQIVQRLRSPLLTMEALSAYWNSRSETEDARPYAVRNGVARLDLKGPLVKEDNFWTWWFGGTSLEAFVGTLRQALTDEEVTEVLLVFDTPGGTLDGTPGAAYAIAQGKALKPINGHVDGCCCSAGYYLGSQCNTLTANPESDVANVGIYTTVTDFSKMLEMEGIEVKLFATGKYKGAGVPGVAMTDAHEEQFRELVSAPFQLFKDAVQSGRNLSAKVLAEVAEGKVYMAGDAVSLGLIDRVGYMTDGVPPAVETPDTTPDGEPQAPPSDEGEEQTRMDPLKLLKQILGIEAAPAAATETETQANENRGSHTSPPVAVPDPTAQARIADLEAQVQAAQAQLQTLREANNLLMMDTYVRKGLITPASREMQSKIRLLNPETYDEAMAAAMPHVAFGGGQGSTPSAESVPALSILQSLQPQTPDNQPLPETAQAYIARNKAQVEAGNGLTKVMGGKK